MISPRSAFSILLLGLIMFRGISLATYWWEQPAIRLGWLALAIWLAPLAWSSARRRLKRSPVTRSPMSRRPINGRPINRRPASHWGRGSVALLSLAITSCLAGWVSDVNAGFSVAIAISFVGLTGWNHSRVCTVVAAISWMPLFDVLVDGPNFPATTLRFTLASIPALSLLWGHSAARSKPLVVLPVLARPPSLWQQGSSVKKGGYLSSLGLILVVGIGAWIHQRSNATSDIREFNAITEIPMKGLDYVSTTMPLDPTERVALGPRGFAVRRYVQFRGVPFIVTLVDASVDPHAIHSPTLCMGSRGWQTQQTEAIPTTGGEVRLIEMVKNRKADSNHRQVAYWFSQKGERHASFTKYRWQHFCTRICFWSPPSPSTFVMVHFLDSPLTKSNKEMAKSVLDGCSLFASL